MNAETGTRAVGITHGRQAHASCNCQRQAEKSFMSNAIDFAELKQRVSIERAAETLGANLTVIWHGVQTPMGAPTH